MKHTPLQQVLTVRNRPLRCVACYNEMDPTDNCNESAKVMTCMIEPNCGGGC